MAPKRKTTANAAADTAAVGRTTRSSTRRANAAADPEPPAAKKAKTTAGKKGKPKTPPKSPAAKKEARSGGASKTIIIEHCKQCSRFKTRAAQVKNGLEKGVAGVNVVVNPEKPRRGCFEIREEGGEVFVSLLDLKRPFKKMTDLDMDEVVADIVEKIK